MVRVGRGASLARRTGHRRLRRIDRSLRRRPNLPKYPTARIPVFLPVRLPRFERLSKHAVQRLSNQFLRWTYVYSPRDDESQRETRKRYYSRERCPLANQVAKLSLVGRRFIAWSTKILARPPSYGRLYHKHRYFSLDCCFVDGNLAGFVYTEIVTSKSSPTVVLF